MTLLALPLSVLSPGGLRARLSILIFHRVLPVRDEMNPDEPDRETFRERMQWVRRWFNVLPLAEAVQRLAAGTLPSQALCITFDDGYADNVEIAAPILRDLGLTATFFVATGFLDGGCMWNDRVIEAVRRCPGPELEVESLGVRREASTPALRRAAALELLNRIKHLSPEARKSATDAIVDACGADVPSDLMMTSDQVRKLRSLGMDLGGHTVTHPILTRLPAQRAMAEMAEGKSQLEAISGAGVSLFAYPNGVPDQDYGAAHAAMARECGFQAAVSTAWGAASTATDRYQLPRFTPWDRTRSRFGLRMLANLRVPAKIAA